MSKLTDWRVYSWNTDTTCQIGNLKLEAYLACDVSNCRIGERVKQEVHGQANVSEQAFRNLKLANRLFSQFENDLLFELISII